MMRLLTEGIANVRARYLFPLARYCGVPPQLIDTMRLTDFANLTEGIDEVIASNAPG